MESSPQDEATGQAESPPEQSTAPEVESPTSQMKVCPSCSVQSLTTGDYCQHCGAPYTSRKTGRQILQFARSKAGRWTAVGVAATLLLGGGLGIAAKVRHDAHVKAEAAALRENQRQAEATASWAKKQADREAELKREERKSLVSRLEDSILRYAKEKVTEGILDGPILRATCTPLGGGSTDDLTALTATLSCMAVNKKLGDGRSSGYVFSATIDWDTGRATWHLG